MKYQGLVEGLVGREIVGWCISTVTPLKPIFVSIYDGDRLVGTADANVYRQRLPGPHAPGHHGFAFELPDRVLDGQVRFLSIFAGPGSEELPGSPVRVRFEAESQSRQPLRSPRAAVVCWDLSHNPVGRAYVLYKLLEPDWRVDLVGPIWPQFGSDLWAPVRNENLSIRQLRVSTLADLWREGAKLALTQAYDLVIICKPRLPSLILGLQLAEQSRCPIIIDVDEDDRTFTKRDDERSLGQQLQQEPFGHAGTELAYRNLHAADAVTISNRALQAWLPGHVVRHARDEATPRPDRAESRRRFGYHEDDFVIAFIGSARAHKGVSHVLDALEKAGDTRLKLLLAGAIPEDVRRRIAARGLQPQVCLHEQFDLAELGKFLSAADLVPILQDIDAEIAKTQMPAKLTDALQHGVQVAATNVAPLRDLAERGVIDVVGVEDFADYLRETSSAPFDPLAAAKRRRVFEEEFSFAINRPRLAFAIAEATAHYDARAPQVRNVLRELLAASGSSLVINGASARQKARSPRSEESLDLAFFWKQNDSGLFGRRSDMIVKHFLKSGRVGKIVHFDHSIVLADLRRMAKAEINGNRDVSATQVNQTLERALGLADHENFRRRLFLGATNDSGGESFGGGLLAAAGDYPKFVTEVLEAEGMDPGKTIAWVWPVVQGFVPLAQEVGFGKIVVDLVDDQRAWQTQADQRTALHDHYASTLGIADHVFTNCEGNRRGFGWARADIVVVPNGAELPSHMSEHVVPHALRTSPRPIIGYVGNLRERIDWDIVKIIAQQRPLWTLVLAGPVETDRLPDWVSGQPNILLPGPVPYELSSHWMRAFDVAIMPHVNSPMTAAMNPLKLYNYLAAGASVVATPVPNIEEVSDLVEIASTPQQFLSAIERVLSAPRTSVATERLRTFSWDERIAKMLRVIDEGA